MILGNSKTRRGTREGVDAACPTILPISIVSDSVRAGWSIALYVPRNSHFAVS